MHVGRYSPLHLAILAGAELSAEELCFAGASLKQKDKRGRTADDIMEQVIAGVLCGSLLLVVDRCRQSRSMLFSFHTHLCDSLPQPLPQHTTWPKGQLKTWAFPPKAVAPPPKSPRRPGCRPRDKDPESLDAQVKEKAPQRCARR